MACRDTTAPCGQPVPLRAAGCDDGCGPRPAGPCRATTTHIGPLEVLQDSNGCLTFSLRGAVPDGIYTNPEVEMRGGFVVGIRTGRAALQAVAPLCAPAGQPAPAPGLIVLQDDPCNLLRRVGTTFAASLHYESSGPLSITGCGTEANPLRFELNLPGAVAGATVQACGINIEDGVVKEFDVPVMAVVADENTGLQATWDPLTCTVTLNRLNGDAELARMPAVICDGSVDPPNGLVVGTPDAVYVLRLPNTSTVAYTVTCSGIGVGTVSNMSSGVYEVFADGVSLGYLSYTRCAYVPPP